MPRMCEVEDERHSIEHREKRRMERETDEQKKKNLSPHLPFSKKYATVG